MEPKSAFLEVQVTIVNLQKKSFKVFLPHNPQIGDRILSQEKDGSLILDVMKTYWSFHVSSSNETSIERQVDKIVFECECKARLHMTNPNLPK